MHAYYCCIVSVAVIVNKLLITKKSFLGETRAAHWAVFSAQLGQVLFLMKPVLRNPPPKHHVKTFFDFRGQLTSLISCSVKNSQS